MSIRRLRTLIAIQKHGSFSSAAVACRITHAAVSQQMKSLEALWQIEIFDRSKKKPFLTPVGKTLVSQAHNVVEAYDRIPAVALGNTGFEGTLTLGAVPTTLTGLVPLALSILRRRHKHLRVVIHPGLSTQLIQLVDRGTIDAAVITRPFSMPEGLSCSNIAAEPMQLLAPPKTRSDDPIELLRTRPFIRFDRNAIFGQMVEIWLQKLGIKVIETMELEGLEAISSMVMANLGVSIVPKRCVQSINPLPIKRLPLSQHAPARQLGLSHRDGNPKLKVIRATETAFVDAVKIGKFPILQ